MSLLDKSVCTNPSTGRRLQGTLVLQVQGEFWSFVEVDVFEISSWGRKNRLEGDFAMADNGTSKISPGHTGPKINASLLMSKFTLTDTEKGNSFKICQLDRRVASLAPEELTKTSQQANRGSSAMSLDFALTFRENEFRVRNHLLRRTQSVLLFTLRFA